tara:strand:+ start:1096 stop:2292 length:1197 start_codon:yes stop_codon:yes gene_type:complete
MSDAIENVEVNEVIGTEESDLNTGSAMSFDDLDSLTNTKNSQELMNDAKDFLEKGSEETSTKEEGKSKVPAKDKRKEEIAESEEGEEATEVEAEEKEETRYKQGSFKDIAQEVAEETTFRHKVDGEEIDVTLKDLLENYSGKVPYDKRFNELNISKKEYEKSKEDYDKEKEYINNYIGEFAEKMQSGKAVEALGFLAEFAGMKPYEFKQQLIQNLTPEIDRRRTLSQDQLSNEQLQEENKYLEQMRESEKQSSNQQQAYTELEQKISALQSTYGISDDDFDNAYDELKETDLKDQLNPELIVNYLRHKDAFTRADVVINDVQPSLASNQYVVDAIEKIIFDNPEFTKEQVTEIVKDIYGGEQKKASKAVSKKMQNKSKEQPTRTSEEYENFVDFDDFD